MPSSLTSNLEFNDADGLGVAGSSRPRRKDYAAVNGASSRAATLPKHGAAVKDEGETQQLPTSPSRPHSRPHPSLPTRPRRDNEFSRGASGSSTNKVLFDPTKLHEVRRVEPGSTKKLFDPVAHDPRSFTSLATPPSLPDTESAPSTSTTAKRLLRRAAPGTGSGSGQSGSSKHTWEIDADRERERRRRREGSERGSTLSGKKKDSDARSKGSKSSEGSESFKDRERGKGKNDTGVKPILKKIHDEIKELEQELIEIHRKMAQDPEAGISALSSRKMDSRTPKSPSDDAVAWVQLISKHKQLADLHDHFLTTLFDPLVPSSYHQLSIKYNIPSRLWQTAFFLILEQLRHAWVSHHPSALDLLTDVVYDAYRFYSELLENQALSGLRGAWIEALGDLARYRMTIASHVADIDPRKETERIRDQRQGADDDNDQDPEGKPPLSGASIGAEVAQNWDVEDKETWRVTARDWYTMGITEKPGEGRLHHHLALLCRDMKGQEGRALHHFVKSLVVTHEFSTSRETILPLFDTALQSQRSLPEATAMDLFIRLHGMLFTRISLDSFPDVMSRYVERLEEDARLDGVSRKATISQVDWMIMGVVNIAGVLQYGSASGIIRKALAQEGAERRKAQAQNADDEEGEDVGENLEEVNGISKDTELVSLPASVAESDLPITYTHALFLTFAVFGFSLAHPNRIQGFHQVLNPYIIIVLTFLATLFRQPHVGVHLLPYVPWQLLADFINSANLSLVEEKRLANGAPLPEDWLIRGSEWVGRRVYERGFWKGKSPSGRGSSGLLQAQPRSGERFQSEMDVLLSNFDASVDIQEGVVDEAEGTDLTDGPAAVNQRRWKRVAWAVGVLAKSVEGFEIRDGKVYVEGALQEKVKERERRKEEEERREREVLERKRQEREKEEKLLGLEMGEESDDQELVDLRRKLQDLKAQAGVQVSRKSRKAASNILDVVAGYTMLIFDTNILLDSLELVNRIVESGQWSVVVPLPVVTELDGLSKEHGALGAAARAAVALLEERIRTHALCLKIQTTKGNYLSDLLIRTEQIDSSTYASSEAIARTMDDRIVHIASFAQEHFVDRTILLAMPRPEKGATKVLLISNDRNLRLKAKARGVEVANEKELGVVLARV